MNNLQESTKIAKREFISFIKMKNANFRLRASNTTNSPNGILSSVVCILRKANDCKQIQIQWKSK